MNHAAQQAAQAYSQIGVQSGVGSASPEQLIQMLMAGCLDRLAAAHGAMERGEVANKARDISKAMAIIDGLRCSLDSSADATLCENLEALYDYMNRQLLQANLHNESNYIEEVVGLMKGLKDAWDQVVEQQQPALSAGAV